MKYIKILIFMLVAALSVSFGTTGLAEAANNHAFFSAPAPAPATLQQAQAAGNQVLFRDEFTGTTARWQHTKRVWRRQDCKFANKQSSGVCNRNAPHLDNHGHLVLPSKPTVGSVIGTFVFDQSPWPAVRNTIGTSWQPPFTIALRAKLPSDAGWTGAGWMQCVSCGSNIAELDFGEETTARAFTAQSFHHMWRNTKPIPPGAQVYDNGQHWLLAGNRKDVGRVAGVWHTYGMQVTKYHVVYTIDGKVILVAPGVGATDWFGLLLQNIAGKTGSWIAGYPDPDLAPWPAPTRDAKAFIDSVLVTRPSSASLARSSFTFTTASGNWMMNSGRYSTLTRAR